MAKMMKKIMVAMLVGIVFTGVCSMSFAADVKILGKKLYREYEVNGVEQALEDLELEVVQAQLMEGQGIVEAQEGLLNESIHDKVNEEVILQLLCKINDMKIENIKSRRGGIIYLLCSKG